MRLDAADLARPSARLTGLALALCLLLAGSMALADRAVFVSNDGGSWSFDDDPAGWLGIATREETGHAEGGARITHVSEDSPAWEAGLREGDIVVRFDGRTIRGPRALSERVRDREPGDRVEVVVLRDGSERTFDVELGSMEEAAERSLAEMRDRLERLQIDLENLDFEMPDLSHLEDLQLAMPDLSHLENLRFEMPDLSHLENLRFAMPDLSHLENLRFAMPDLSHLEDLDFEMPDLSHLENLQFAMPDLSPLEDLQFEMPDLSPLEDLDFEGGSFVQVCDDGDCRGWTGYRSSRPKLGVELVQTTPELREHLGGDRKAGVLVDRVLRGSAADDAGLQVGDLLVSIDGEPVSSASDVRRLLGDRGWGERVEVEIVRDGARQRLDATLPEASADAD